MRCFYAIPIPEYVKEEILSAISPFRHKIPAKWVIPEHLHITLLFLGEISEHDAEIARGALDTLIFQLSNISIDSIDYSPGRMPRMVWAYIKENPKHEARNPKLEDMKAGLEGYLEKHGVKFQKDNRGLLPHVCLCRFTPCPRESLPKIGTQVEAEFIAERIVLYQSTLTREGPIYREIASREL